MVFSEDSIIHLRDTVASRMSENRFLHTIGVEKMVIRLGKIFLPDRISELRVAAILHDVSKEMDIEEQLYYIDSCDKIAKKQKCVPQALHSFSGAALVERDFSDYATDDVLYAIMHHTLGDENMNLFSEIIFLADYIEEGRSYPESAFVRDELFDMIDKAFCYDEKVKALHNATVLAINFTLESLHRRGLVPDERSIKTKKAFEALI